MGADIVEKEKAAEEARGDEYPIDAAAKAPTPDIPEEMTPFAAYTRVFTYGGAFEYTLQAIAIVAALGSGAGIALQNLIFGRFVTVITGFVSGVSSPPGFRSDAAELALYFVYLGIGRLVLSYIYNSLFTYVAYRLVRNMRYAYLRAALSQEVAYYDFGTGGSIATQATSNGRQIQNGIAEKLGLTFQGLAAFVTAFIIAVVVQWKLALICLCIAPAIIIVMGVVASIEAGFETKMMEIHAQGNAFTEAVLSGVRTVHAFDMRARLVNRFNTYLTETHRIGDKISPLFGILFSAEYTIIYLGFGLAFWQGVRMMATGEIEDPGTIFTVLLSVVIGSIQLTILAPYAIDFGRAASAAVMLFRLIDRKSSIDPFDEDGEQPTETEGVIEIENVTFAYPTRPSVTVLDNFSLKVPSGKVTALVGQSGSGKSTIVGLIERWYNPESGTIKLDGRPIDMLNLNWLRKNVRLVQQEPVLFQGSVFDNIKHGLIGTEWENASREKQMELIQHAAKMAFAHDFISELPNGYGTQIGQRGGLLSGGQKQRVAIARSIVSQPKVLLLDEATSALDPHAEGVVQQALDKAAEGRTTIVIAHKLATIRKADNIVVMRNGRIIEQGSHESLIADGGAYARLVEIQSLAVGEGKSETETEDTQNPDPADLHKPLTRYASSVQGRMEAKKERDNYDHHKQFGMLHVVFRLMKMTPELFWWYVLVLLGCIGASGIFPGQAILLANVMDVFTLTGAAMEREGNFYAKMFIVLAAGALISYFALGWSTNCVAQALSQLMRRQSFDMILRQDLQFFDREENSTGALSSRIDSNAQSILELMGFNVGLITISVLNVLTCSILAIAHSWNLGLVVVFGGLPPLFGAAFLKIKLDSKLDRDTSKRYSASASIASEAVNAIRTVSSLAIEKSVLEQYTNELDHALSDSTPPLFAAMICFGFTQAIEYWFMALGFWYGCRLLSFDKISMYNFFVAFLAVFFSGQATAQLFQFSTSITKGVNGANYILWLSGLESTIRQTPENLDKGPGSAGPIALDDIRFSYPLRPDAQVLRGINLTVEKGRFVAFVGASGCGKSTMIAMLERFYDPTTGRIVIDGSDLTTLNPRLYRRIVSFVQQEPILFKGSIRENIALGLDDPTMDELSSTDAALRVSDEKIEAALRGANAWGFVSSLPDGLNTQAGSGGTQLSGGQRQRIAIARSLIRDPKVLLLDEATSALDTESEKIVQGALNEAAKDADRITFAVAHRLSTIKDADVICVFYGGKIAEMGTHEELIANSGMYRRMCEAQALD
ncbi:multidrug resistance protein [Eremomyces bilateralis CBS 781.70]|uniref:Multidrug resistance protein n=1 Tax=Eremomyces bilateralis CBS 781.70 TaxID=1392243 RepID=A0A6G1GH01_9PEZI|nr:multidrug resistance protein [Eremomyces bilateralis CBS 781.70]XP_033538780.1 multidrug resistance protein [Eremomyces bilateralis CBS 781.70]KAF1807947.1 multidrug resistance protein [Eremomyces bilateralis CBS 781.70]KAF1817149.1 multidrug resistance protein [Eremomyces bilateralis CBS 781.70]